ncbi:MAG: AMIN domain-containing protein [Candidatus Aminicenantes bacterium]|nr:AMIN domain-containing protein [Candidatus Aminicenantes bacterium]
MTGNKVWGRIVFLTIVLTICFFMSGFGLNDFRQEAQSPVSFYENLLFSGEEALFSGEYQRAIKELEIAAFGLFHRKSSAAKAYILMSLSYYHLKNREKAEEFLKNAALLVNEEELRAIELNIDTPDRDVLESLIQDFDVFGSIEPVSPEIEEEPVSLEKPLSAQKKKKQDKKEQERIEQDKVDQAKKEQERIEQDKKEQEKKTQEKKKMPETVDDRIAQLIEQRKKQQQEEKTEIKGLEELFVLDEPVQESNLSEIRIQKGTNSIVIGILFQPYTQHQAFEIIDTPPKRIVIDISNITGIRAVRSIDINDFGITSIRTGMFKVNVARVVFDAEGDLPTYRIEKAEGGLRVVIEKSPL